MKKKITKKSKIGEIVGQNPEVVDVLFEAGMMCCGCPMAQQETLEEGCLAHGMAKKDIDKLVEKLNRK